MGKRLDRGLGLSKDLVCLENSEKVRVTTGHVQSGQLVPESEGSIKFLGGQGLH